MLDDTVGDFGGDGLLGLRVLAFEPTDTDNWHEDLPVCGEYNLTVR